MERRLNKKIEVYILEIKNNIRDKINELNFTEKDKINDLLEYIYDYERLQFYQEDLSKRKRVKNTIPITNRCNACRANGERCTRRQKKDSEFCGTHIKGAPHGISTEDNQDNNTNKLEIVATDVMGIIYYIDNYKNVYKTEDIMNNIENPRIIAKCQNNLGIISIPDLNLP
tara:strand:- start:309 stop:821 length:513 start_codon:yes stop_codon:yes gene_type:complete